MATKQFNSRIQLKKDTSANWTANNPVLLNGEIAIVVTNAGETRFKVGDGTSSFTALPFQDEFIQDSITEVDDALLAHETDTGNPHAVTKSQVGLGNVDNVKQYSANNPPPYPVTSVNGDTGAVNLTASDVGALSTQTGTQGQFLGFISDNVVGAVDAPTSTSPFNTSYNGILASGSGNWTASGGQYYQQITLSEMTSIQTPIVFPQWTTNITNEQTAWNNLTSIQSYNGYVRFYASAPTTTNVNFILLYTNYSEELVRLITNGSGTVGTFTPI